MTLKQTNKFTISYPSPRRSLPNILRQIMLYAFAQCSAKSHRGLGTQKILTLPSVPSRAKSPLKNSHTKKKYIVF